VNAAEVIEGLRTLTALAQSPERRTARWLRVESMALAHRNPELFDELASIQERTVAAHVEAFAEM
jgi:hypothetical protein